MIISDLELELRDGLAHLYDPGFQPSGKLCVLFGCGGPDESMTIQTKIVRGIESLKPGSDVPLSSRTIRYYEILHRRFVLRLTLEETALHLHMSVSSTWREQRAAIHFLTTEIWRQNHAEDEPVSTREQDAGKPETAHNLGPAGDEPSEWLLQTKRELASLQSLAPDVISDISKLVQQICELEAPLAAKYGVRLEIGQIKPDLEAAVHPSVLRQILIVVIGMFLRHMSGGKIVLFARLEDGIVLITLAGSIDPGVDNFKQLLLGELVLPDDSSVEIIQDGKQVFVWVKLRSVIERLNVLALDDNQDMIRFFQRASEGTSYRIIPFDWESNLFEVVLKNRPDIIILDVMLPGTDGWELLMKIRANPATRPIPVIVCSVVKGEELALSLGAARFITKPIRPQDFVQALDQVLAQTP
jgi:CheY-like chemotaxis protein